MVRKTWKKLFPDVLCGAQISLCNFHQSNLTFGFCTHVFMQLKATGKGVGMSWQVGITLVQQPGCHSARNRRSLKVQAETIGR